MLTFYQKQLEIVIFPESNDILPFLKVNTVYDVINVLNHLRNVGW